MKDNQVFFAVSCGLVLACGFVLCSGSIVVAEETGNISVSTSPVGGGIYVGTFYVGSGHYIGEYALGNHTISFGKVGGFKTPENEVINLESNETEYINVAYIKLLKGTLIVNTTPVGGDIYINGYEVGNGYFEGKYEENTVLEISFGGVEGYITPAEVEVMILANMQTSMEGEYVGLLNGLTNGTAGRSDGDEIDVEKMLYEKSKYPSLCNESHANTTQVISSGGGVYHTQSALFGSADAGNVSSVTETHTKRTAYWINVTTTSEDGKIQGDQGAIFVDNVSIGVGRGAIPVDENSNHVISWGAVEGYKKPYQISVTQITGDWNISRSYTHIPWYTVNIATKYVEGKIKVNGVFKGKGSFEGEYCEGTNLIVSFGDVGDCLVGYETPESLNIIVDSNKSEVVYYKKLPSKTLSIITVAEDGTPVKGFIYVDGTPQGWGMVEVECRSDRSHEVVYGDCGECYDNEQKKPKYSTPLSETVDLTKNTYVEGIYRLVKYPPTAKIIPVEPETALYGVVTFNAGASWDLDGYITRYIWDFSDGTAEGEMVSRRFTTTGKESIKLTVIDNDGDQSTDMVTVVVKRKPIVKLTKISDNTIGISIFNPMVRPAEPHKNPAAVSMDVTVEVNSRTGVTMSTDGLLHCNLDQGEKFEKEIWMECDEPYEVWVEYTYRFQDEDELRRGRTNSLIMPAKPSEEELKPVPNLPIGVGIFIILLVFTIKKRRY